MPYPAAITAQRLQSAIELSADALKTLFSLKDCFESVIKYFGVLLLTEYIRSPACTKERNQTLLEKMVRPSLGSWVSTVVGDLSRWLVTDAGEFSGQVSGFFVQPPRARSSKPQPTALLRRCEEFVTYRNDTLGHGATRRDAVYRADLAGWLPLVQELLDAIASLHGCRLVLVADYDRCQVWMGPEPGGATEPGIFTRDQIGHFLLRKRQDSPTGTKPGQGDGFRDLYPFLCYVPDAQQQRRLHFYDSIYRYQETRKEVHVLEYDEGFKQATADPVAGLEEAFTRELLSHAFHRHRGRMEVIEGRVASFGELLAAHADIVGRGFAIDHVKRFIAEHDRGVLVIEAEPGKGKTALLCHLIENEFGHFSPLPVHFFYRRTAGITDPDVCVRSLYTALLETHDIQEAEESKHQRSPEEMYTKLANLLITQIGRRLTPSRPQLIFLDALDESEATAGGQTAYQRIPENLPASVYVIATTRPVHERSSLARRKHLHWYNLDSPDLVQANLRDGRDYVRRELAGSGLPEESLEEIARVGRGNFLVLKLLCGHVRAGLESWEVSDFLKRLATGEAADQLGFIYEEFWTRITNRVSLEERHHLSDVAGMLITAKASVPADLVCRALSLRAADWDLSLRRLVEFLTVIPFDEEGTKETYYRMYHESFADFLRAKLATDRMRFDRLLGDYCLHWAELPEGFGRSYALRFGPAHLVAARRWDELETLLTDIFFLEAKTKYGLVFDLAVDFAAAVAALPDSRPKRRVLELVEEALRRDIHFISRHAQDYPQGLFQSLWNSCWWYDCPDAGGHYVRPPSHSSTNRRAPCDAVSDSADYGATTRPLTTDLRLNHGTEDAPRLHTLLERWREEKNQAEPGFVWLRALRPPWMQLKSSQRAVLKAHEESVTCVAYSPLGHRIASGSWDRTARLWDAYSGAEVFLLRGHESGVTSVAFSPNGSRLATASGSITGDDDNTARLWDVSTGEELAVFRGQERGVTCAAFSPDNDGELLYTGSWDGTVRVWDVSSGEELAVWQTGEPPVASVTSIAVYSGGDWIAIGTGGGTVSVLCALSGMELIAFRGHEDRVTSVAISPNGKLLASGSRDGTVRVWNVHPDALERRQDLLRVLLGTVQAWNIHAGEELAILRGHGNSVTSVAFSRDGDRLASASIDHTVCLWDGTRDVERREHESAVNAVSFSPDGDQIITGCSDGTVRAWRARGGDELSAIRGHYYGITSLAISRRGDRIVTGSADDTARAWNASNGHEQAVLNGHEECVTKVVLSPDEKRVASASSDHTVRVWDAFSGEQLLVLRGHEDEVTSVAFSPNGDRAASASRDGWVRVWNAQSGERLLVLRGNRDGLTSVAFSPNGDRLVVCGRGTGDFSDYTVRVWDARTGSELVILDGHTDGVTSAGFSPSGDRIVSASLDHTVRVWDAYSGAELAVLEHDNEVDSVVFSVSGDRIVSRTVDYTVFVWEAQSGECLDVIEGCTDMAETVADSHRFPFRALVRDLGFAIARSDTGSIIARFPVPLDLIVSYPCGRAWAGASGSYLCLLMLEGCEQHPSTDDRAQPDPEQRKRIC